MGMKNGQKQYGDVFHAKVRELRGAGLTRRQIAKKMEVSNEVIEKMYKRQNRADRMKLNQYPLADTSLLAAG